MRSVQTMELVALAGLVLGGAVLLGTRRHDVGGLSGRAIRAAIGILAGCLGAVIILVPREDFLADDVEAYLAPALIVGVTVILVAGTVYRLTRR